MERFIFDEMVQKMHEFQTLTGTNAILLTYANSKIEELDARRQQLMKAISDLTAEGVSPEQANRISGYLEKWNNISFDDRRQVVDGLVSCVRATSDTIQIEWKI